MRVRAYWRETNEKWSLFTYLDHGWRKYSEIDSLALRNVIFNVSHAGLNEFIRFGRKRHHYYIEGDLLPDNLWPEAIRADNMGPVMYDPWKRLEAFHKHKDTRVFISHYVFLNKEQMYIPYGHARYIP